MRSALRVIYVQIQSYIYVTWFNSFVCFTTFPCFSIRHISHIDMMWRGVTVIHEFIVVSLHLEAIISTQHWITVHVLLKCSWLSCLGCSICQHKQPQNYSLWQHRAFITAFYIKLECVEMSVKIAYMHQHKKRSVFCQDKMDRSIYEEQLLQCEVKKKKTE